MASTTVVIQQPQGGQNQLLVYGSRRWNSGLCDCLEDFENCCYTMFCFPCAVSKIATRTGECFCTPYCVPGSGVAIRARIRTMGGIKGNLCDDCLTVVFCGPCSACQEARELTDMGL